MRLELAIALKYLLPKRGSLSSSIVSLLSVGVISLVVWLSIVFLSVVTGLEKRWTKDILSFSAPIKLNPSLVYFSSPYFNLEVLKKENRNSFFFKTLGEKLKTPLEVVEKDFIETFLGKEPPKDIVKETWRVLSSLKEYNPVVTEYYASLGTIQFVSKEIKTPSIYFSSSDNLSLKPCLSHLFTTFKTEFFTESSIILPSQFLNEGIRIGDKARISFYFSNSKEVNKTREVTVKGFYESGLSSISGRIAFIHPKIIRPFLYQEFSEDFSSNGLDIYITDINKTEKIKEDLIQKLKENELGDYWNISSLFDSETFRPLLDQVKNDKILFSFIAIIIVLVACSNILAMLLLLVNDKKKEIGILQAMGASKKSILFIFGASGMFIGFLGSLIGICGSFFTLKYLNIIVSFLSLIQGRPLFQERFFGSRLPNDFSLEIIIFIGLATCTIAFISGLIPAIKAVRIPITETLKAD